MPAGLLGRPRYASCCGIQTRISCPTDMSCRASVQPGITRFSGKVAGCPRATLLSKPFPSVVQPV